jgi:hypothetical protein
VFSLSKDNKPSPKDSGKNRKLTPSVKGTKNKITIRNLKSLVFEKIREDNNAKAIKEVVIQIPHQYPKLTNAVKK